MLHSRNRVVIVTDQASRYFSDKIAALAKRVTTDVHLLDMDSLSNGHRRKFPLEWRKIWEESPRRVASLYIHHQKNKGYNQHELINMLDPLDTVASQLGIKHLQILGLTNDFIDEGLVVKDYSKVCMQNDWVARRVRNAKEVVLKSKHGTDLTVIVSPEKIGWVKEDIRNVEYGKVNNLPMGEIFTTPVTANGVIVLHGLIGHFEKYGLFNRYPLRMKIEEGQITEINRNRKSRIVNELEEILISRDSTRTIAELAFGTNMGMRQLFYNDALAEKSPGVHVAFGDPAIYVGGEWESPEHIDMILQDITAYADGVLLMEGGRYLNDPLVSSAVKVGKTRKKGRGLYADRNIQPGEFVFSFFGSSIKQRRGEYSVQIGPGTHLEPEEPTNLINHSCEPNCGIKGRTNVQSMREIRKGEELTIDYAMVEDNLWGGIACLCGTSFCRGNISGFDRLPSSFRKRYKGFISEYLVG